MKELPGQFPHFEEWLKERNFINRAKKWHIEREYLKQINVDFKNMTEEINLKIIDVNYEDILEWKLIKKLLKFDEIIISVEKDLMPNRLCNYIFELCQIFNRFYDQLKILKVENKTKQSRLILCKLTQKTLKLSLEILGIETLERM